MLSTSVLYFLAVRNSLETLPLGRLWPPSQFHCEISPLANTVEISHIYVQGYTLWRTKSIALSFSYPPFRLGIRTWLECGDCEGVVRLGIGWRESSRCGSWTDGFGGRKERFRISCIPSHRRRPFYHVYRNNTFDLSC